MGEALRKMREHGIGPHIVALQEAFDDRVRELIEASGYPHVLRGPSGGWIKTSAGLCFLSEFKIIDSHHTVFGPGVGWDFLARKGAHLVSIEVPGLSKPVSILNTHLNSNPEAGWNWIPNFIAKGIRLFQAMHLREFIARTWKRHSPLVCVGDFNFLRREDAYASFVSRKDNLPSFQNALDVALKTAFHDNDTSKIHEYEAMVKDLEVQIDHQFVAASAPDLELHPVGFERKFHEPDNGQLLSDHHGLEIHYEIRDSVAASEAETGT